MFFLHFKRNTNPGEELALGCYCHYYCYPYYFLPVFRSFLVRNQKRAQTAGRSMVSKIWKHRVKHFGVFTRKTREKARGIQLRSKNGSLFAEWQNSESSFKTLSSPVLWPLSSPPQYHYYSLFCESGSWTCVLKGQMNYKSGTLCSTCKLAATRNHLKSLSLFHQM